MIGTMRVVQGVLIAATTIVVAQTTPAQQPATSAAPTQVLGTTGSMYDGNNVHLQFPSEPNLYWAELWSGAAPAGASSPAAAGSVTHPTVGGQH